MVIGGQWEVNSRLFNFVWEYRYFIYIDGHPQATVVLCPCSLLTQCVKEATMGITSCASSFVFVESKRERMKKLNCLSIQREGKLWTYIRKREKENSVPAAKAGAQCRVPVPSPPPRHGGRRGSWGQARPMGAGEAGGGRRGW